MNKVKKLLVAVCVVALAAGAEARPHGGGHGRPHGGPVFHHGGGHRGVHHHSAWGRGGRHFWPGFAGGLVAGAVYEAVTAPRTTIVTPVVTPAPVVVTPAPVVVAPPSVTQVQNVWVEGRYVDQVQPNGTVVRVWQPGHYEQTTVVVR